MKFSSSGRKSAGLAEFWDIAKFQLFRDAMLPKRNQTTRLLSVMLPLLTDGGGGGDAAAAIAQMRQEQAAYRKKQEAILEKLLAPGVAEVEAAPEEDMGDEVNSTWGLTARPDVKWEDVAGLDRVKDEIKLKLIYPFTHPSEAGHYGIKSGGGILLYGPPGTGKTHIAKAIANEVDASFFAIRPSEIVRRGPGASEEKISRLFSDARGEKRAVIFIDEVEALVPKRRSTASTIMKRVVPQILAELDGLESKNDNILFIGASNEPWSIDRAALRPGRFDERIYVPPPDVAARKRIFEMNLRDKPVEKLDLDALVEMAEGYSGADIAYICEKASSIPFRESIDGGDRRRISMDDIRATMEEIGPSIFAKMVDKYANFKFES